MKTKLDFYIINKVKEKRLTKGYSQARLANDLGVSYGFIGKVESPKYSAKYNIKHLNKVAEIFNCSPKGHL